MKITFPDGWLDNNPLTLADLDREIQYLRPTGYRLEVDFAGQQVSASH